MTRKFSSNPHHSNIFENPSQSMPVIISHNDMCLFVEKFNEFGAELTSLQMALLAHQNKVREIIFDSEMDDNNN